jgi:hypothetical protein
MGTTAGLPSAEARRKLDAGDTPSKHADNGRMDLVHLVGKCHGRLCVSLKLVYATMVTTGDDELRARGHLLPAEFLTQARYACKFRAVGS